MNLGPQATEAVWRAVREIAASLAAPAEAERLAGIGIDLVVSERVGMMAARYDDRALARVFTAGELRRSRSAASRDRHLAICLGAKEAVAKALGRGMDGIDWLEIEAMPLDRLVGLRLGGRAEAVAAALGVTRWTGCWAEANRSLLAVCVLGFRGPGDQSLLLPPGDA